MDWLRQPKFWRVALRVLVAVLLLGGVGALVRLDDLGVMLRNCRMVPLLHAFLLFLGACVSVGFAWQILLRTCGYRIGVLPALRLSLLGFFFNNMIPSGVTGEIYRIFAIGQMGVTKVHAATSVFVERWSAFLALIIATSVSLWGGWPWLHGVTVGSSLGQFYAPLANVRLDYLLLVFLGLQIAGFVGMSLWLWWAASHRHQAWERYRFGISVPEFIEGTAHYLRYPGVFLAATFINLASPLLEGLAFSSIADALGLELSPMLFLVFTPIFRALNHLPITVNALGTQEVASIVFWQPLGTAPETAVAISILIHALKISISLLGGGCYFWRAEHNTNS